MAAHADAYGNPAAQLAIEARGLRKSFGAVEAVRGVDLAVAAGEVFALLGPNGAGKTTTIEMLEGHLEPSAGAVSVLGCDPQRNARQLRARIGIVLQSTGVERFLTVEETIDLFRGYYPAPLPLQQVLEATGLAEARRTRVSRLSGGQQRRLDVAIGLSGNPDLLFLDEPTTGFDPAARRDAWRMVRGLKELGKTVLLTTHYMDEAAHLADRVAIMVRGQIVAEGPPAELAERGAATAIGFTLQAGVQPPPQALLGTATERGGRWLLIAAQPAEALHRLTGWSLEAGVELAELSVSKPSLEDVFVDLAASAEASDP